MKLRQLWKQKKEGKKITRKGMGISLVVQMPDNSNRSLVNEDGSDKLSNCQSADTYHEFFNGHLENVTRKEDEESVRLSPLIQTKLNKNKI